LLTFTLFVLFKTSLTYYSYWYFLAYQGCLFLYVLDLPIKYLVTKIQYLSKLHRHAPMNCNKSIWNFTPAILSTCITQQSDESTYLVNLHKVSSLKQVITILYNKLMLLLFYDVITIPVKFLTLYRNEKKRMFFQPVKIRGKMERQLKSIRTKKNLKNSQIYNINYRI